MAFKTAFTGAFFGKVAAGLFIAVCAALGFGPDKWAAFILGPSVAPLLARGIFLLLAIATAAALIAPWWKSLRRYPNGAMIDTFFPIFAEPIRKGLAASLAESRKNAVEARAPYLPLQDAARRILEANLDNRLGAHAMSEPTPEDRLNYMAIWIASTRTFPLYGTRPPSTVYEAITPQIFNRYRLADNASTLRDGNMPGKPIVYANLVVRKDELEKGWDKLIYRDDPA